MTTSLYTIQTDKALLDIDLIYDYLSNISYWAKGISKEEVKTAIENSLCFGIYHAQQQVGFARVVSDFARMAYLADVFVVPSHQGNGLGKLLIQHIKSYPELSRMPRWMLITQDAHGLYKQFGFTELSKPEMYMECILRD